MASSTRFAGITRVSRDLERCDYPFLRLRRAVPQSELYLMPEALPTSSAYGWFMLCGIAVTLAVWVRLARHEPQNTILYLGGLCGAFIGAKLAYLAAEGWLHLGT